MLFDLQETDASRDFAWLPSLLSRVDAAARRLLRVEDVVTPEPVPVRLFRTPWQYAHHLARYRIEAGDSRGSYFSGDHGREIAAFTDGLGEHQLAAVIQHEGLHAMVDATFPRPVPHWLNEGLAQCAGDLWLIDTDRPRTVLDPNRLHRLRLMLGDTPPASMTAVTATSMGDWLDTRSTPPGVILAYYDTAWALTYLMQRTRDEALRSAFDVWLEEMRQGGPDDGWDRLIGSRGVEAIEQACQRFYAQPPPPMAINLDRLVFLADALLVMQTHGLRMPRSIDEMRHRLRVLGFEAAVIVPGRPRVRRPVNDPANYEYVTADGQAAPFELFAAEDHRTPPEIAAPFAPGGPSIEWRVLSHRRYTWRMVLGDT